MYAEEVCLAPNDVQVKEVIANGFPQEADHFIACVKDDLPPQETGDDGRPVIEIITAAYESARTGRKVTLPFHSDARGLIDVWKDGEPADNESAER